MKRVSSDSKIRVETGFDHTQCVFDKLAKGAFFWEAPNAGNASKLAIKISIEEGWLLSTRESFMFHPTDPCIVADVAIRAAPSMESEK